MTSDIPVSVSVQCDYDPCQGVPFPAPGSITLKNINNPQHVIHQSSEPATASPKIQAGPPTQPTPKKIHLCPWEGCGRLFACQHNVKQHVREKHTLEKPFVCGECAKEGREAAFCRPFTLNRHVANVHNLKPGPGKDRMERQEVFDEAAPVKTEVPGEWNGMAARLRAAIAEDDVMATAPANVGEFVNPALLMQADVPQYWQMGQSLDFDPIGVVSRHGDRDQNAGHAYCYCGKCGHGFETTDMVLGHLHGTHEARSSRLCPCTVCQMTHLAAQDDRAEQERLLRNGGFGVKGDGGMYYPNSLTAPIVASDMETKLPNSAFGDLILDLDEY